MRRLGAIGFYRDSNPQLFERFEEVCRRIEAQASPGVLAALRRWQDPSTHKGEHRPVTAMVARPMFDEGRYEEAETLFAIAARTVTPYGSWELQYTYAMLLCRIQVLGSLDDDGRRIAAEYARRGESLLSLGPSRTGATERFTGELLLLEGDALAAIPYLVAAGPEAHRAGPPRCRHVPGPGVRADRAIRQGHRSGERAGKPSRDLRRVLRTPAPSVGRIIR